MNSRSRSAAPITVPRIAPATNALGGGRLALTQSMLPAGSGERRAEQASGGLNEGHHLDRMALPFLLIQRTRTSALLRARKKKRPYRIFLASRARSGRMRGDQQ